MTWTISKVKAYFSPVDNEKKRCFTTGVEWVERRMRMDLEESEMILENLLRVGNKHCAEVHNITRSVPMRKETKVIQNCSHCITQFDKMMVVTGRIEYLKEKLGVKE